MEMCQAGPGCARLRAGLGRLLPPVFPGLRLSLPGVLLWLCLTASFSPVLTSLLGPQVALCLPECAFAHVWLASQNLASFCGLLGTALGLLCVPTSRGFPSL